MINFLDFKDAVCKNCYLCLRECPVKAIKMVNHHAKVIDARCILCGNCTLVCPQNAKQVHSQVDYVKNLLKTQNVIASVAPAFISSFDCKNFFSLKKALLALGFSDALETAEGAKIVTEEYRKMLKSGKYKNLITSACPSINKLIQQYYPNALEYLAPCDTPMVTHAKLIKSRSDAKVVFIGPCIAKQKEAYESNVVDGVLTFEDLAQMLSDANISLEQFATQEEQIKDNNKSRYYPISRGIIKSFDKYESGYEFVAISGLNEVKQVLENIDNLENLFLELNSCNSACISGPCNNKSRAESVLSNAKVRKYTAKNLVDGELQSTEKLKEQSNSIDINHEYKTIKPYEIIPTEAEITKILAKIGKTKPEDELNCGACGYRTCREKAWAVANGYAQREMCVPYMRERAESMSLEIIQNSPNGIVVCDYDLHITEINNKAVKMYGLGGGLVKGQFAGDLFNASQYLEAISKGYNIYRKRIFIDSTKSYAELTVTVLPKQKIVFGVLTDITEQAKSESQLNEVKLKTLKTTEEVIKKQMVVAQEIASLLGETTAETKVALLKLKNTLESGGND